MNGSRHKLRVGEVVSNKAEKTVVVAVEWRLRHRLYKKSMRRISKFYAHDEKNECRKGDRVEIALGRPLSKRKRWHVSRILEKAQ